MKHLIILVFFCLCFSASSAQNNCAGAIAVAPGIHDVSILPGSTPPQPVCIPMAETATNGAWFAYTPTEAHTSTVSTDINDSPDTRVHIYSGSCGTLTCVAGDDDSGSNESSIVHFNVEPGATYYIVFDNYWGVVNFSFSLTEGPVIPPLFSPQTVNIDGIMLCIADMNGDYLDDIAAPFEGGVTILYQNSTTPGFTTATLTAPATLYLPYWTIAAGDYDNNGYNDLLYGHGEGAAIMLANATGTAFITKLESDQFVYSQRTNFVDINNDGNLDAFICHDLEPNVYFLNNGEGGFTFHQGGLGDLPSGGNYGSVWTDYDNDGDLDLFIAKCRGAGDDAAIDELHRNNGDGTFTNVAAQANLADYHQSWSGAWGDYDNDGDMDVLIGASSDIAGGHKLMINNGDGTFSNGTAGSGYDTFTPLDIEHVAHDFNNDGFVDIFGGGSAIMLNNGDMTFTPTPVSAVQGPIGDLNNDGFLDIQNENIIYFNIANDNNWIKINLEGTESNRNGIGARIEVYTAATGIEKQIRDVKSGDGFRYMSSLNAHFGLGNAEAIEKVVVKWPSGVVDMILNPSINASLLVVEGEHAMGTNDNLLKTLTIHPNPAKDYITIQGIELPQETKADIYDLSGKLTDTFKIANNTISISSLLNGAYIMIFKDVDGKSYSSKIIKE